MCLKCTVQSDFVMGAFSVYSAELGCHWCVYSAKWRLRELLVCVYSAEYRVRMLLVSVKLYSRE